MKEKADKQHKKEDKVLREGLRKIRNLRGGNKMKKTILILGLIALMTIMVSAELGTQSVRCFDFTCCTELLSCNGNWTPLATGTGYSIVLPAQELRIASRTSNGAVNIKNNSNFLDNIATGSIYNLSITTYFAYAEADKIIKYRIYLGNKSTDWITTTGYHSELITYDGGTNVTIESYLQSTSFIFANSLTFYNVSVREVIPPPIYCIFKGKGLAKGWINKRC